MSIFSNDIGREEEDGGGWGGLVPTKEERKECYKAREDRELTAEQLATAEEIIQYVNMILEPCESAINNCEKELAQIIARHCTAEFRTSADSRAIVKYGSGRGRNGLREAGADGSPNGNWPESALDSAPPTGTRSSADPESTLRDSAAHLLTNLAQILDVVKGEWKESWSDWDQQQRDGITQWLTRYYGVEKETK